MNTWMKHATQMAELVYQEFMRQVVAEHVLADRQQPLSESMRKKVSRGSHINPHPVRLMTISGKGGWHPDPLLAARYAQNNNITLLDHLLSVVRGSVMLAALDWLAQNAEMEEALLQRRLALIVAIAFLHDIDKDLALQRNTELSPEQVEERMMRYGMDDFLLHFNTTLSAEQLLYLLEKVESTQAQRHIPAQLPPRETEILPQYVRLADKLDGIWVSTDPEKGGIPGVLQRLQKDEGTLHCDLLRHWKVLDIFDPHHPFLLDELQRWLSFFSRHISGVPPLLEMHQDGRLFLLLLTDDYAKITEKAVAQLAKKLPFQLELVVSNRGVPALYNGKPNHAELQRFIQAQSFNSLRNLFRIKMTYKETLAAPLDELLEDCNLGPRYPKNMAGASISLYSSLADMDEDALPLLRKAAHLILLLNLKVAAKPKDGVPEVDQREQALLACVDETRPTWISDITDGSSESLATRRIITALWVTVLAEDDDAIEEAVWAQTGLLSRWLIGTEHVPGFRHYISGRGMQVTSEVSRHFGQLLQGKRIVAEDEQAIGRCLFTDQPVALKENIDTALGLYEVKASAFSGRDGRPESVTSEKAHTNVSAVSIAEHRLRKEVHACQGGKAEGVPSLISSPITCGLFAGLRLTNDKAMGAFSLYDLSRQEIKKGTVLYGMEMYQARYRMVRLERMANKTKDQVNQLGMLLRAALRIGRPIHIFRGLPVAQQAFFYYDALPPLLAGLIGGNALRLEQIPQAIEQLKIAQFILDTHNLGYDMLQLYATPATRLQGICLAWCGLLSAKQVIAGIFRQLENAYTQAQEEQQMSEEDGALVKLGQVAAGIQKYVGSSGSTNEQMLVFTLCLSAVNEARLAGQTDESSLIYAAAGELEQNLTRKNKAAAREHRAGQSLMDGCQEVAKLFVQQVWYKAMNNHAPSQRRRRILGSIYRMAFLQAHRQRINEKNA